MSIEYKQYDSITMAEHIMAICDKYKVNDVNYEYNNTKINKILYCIYGYVLAIFGFSITKEKPHFWPYGPVFPNVYRKYDKGKLKAERIDFKDGKLGDLIEQTILNFGKYPAGKLSSWSHSSGTPWDTMHKLNLEWNTEMTDQILYDYFYKSIGEDNINEFKRRS